MDIQSMSRTLDIISAWGGADFLVKFVRSGQSARSAGPPGQPFPMLDGTSGRDEQCSKPVAMVLEPSILPEEAKANFALLRECVSARLPVYYSFASAANAINLILTHNEREMVVN